MMAGYAARPACVRAARRRLVDFCEAAAPADVVELVGLLGSELAANAVAHAGTPFTVSACFDGERLRVEVEDHDPSMPTVLHPDPLATGGRGMSFVDDLASRWGATPTADGKRVWFELDYPRAS